MKIKEDFMISNLEYLKKMGYTKTQVRSIEIMLNALYEIGKTDGFSEAIKIIQNETHYTV